MGKNGVLRNPRGGVRSLEHSEIETAGAIRVYDVKVLTLVRTRVVSKFGGKMGTPKSGRTRKKTAEQHLLEGTYRRDRHGPPKRKRPDTVLACCSCSDAGYGHFNPRTGMFTQFHRGDPPTFHRCRRVNFFDAARQAQVLVWLDTEGKTHTTFASPSDRRFDIDAYYRALGYADGEGPGGYPRVGT